MKNQILKIVNSIKNSFRFVHKLADCFFSFCSKCDLFFLLSVIIQIHDLIITKSIEGVYFNFLIVLKFLFYFNLEIFYLSVNQLKLIKLEKKKLFLVYIHKSSLGFISRY